MKTKFNKLILFACAFVINSQAQITYINNYGASLNDRASSMEITSDKGYIISGWTQVTSGNVDAILLKTDSLGNISWMKNYGNSNDEWSYSVQQTSDGGFVFGGSSLSYGAGNDDMFLVRTNSLGNVIWSKTFGGTGSERISSLRQTSDGGFICAGFTLLTFNAFSNEDFYIVKTNSVGDTLWTKVFGATQGAFSSSDKAYDIIQDNDGGFLVCGTGDNGGLLMKLNPSGGMVWSKAYYASGGNINFYSMKKCSDSGLIFSGMLSGASAKGGIDAIIMKTDSAGAIEWCKKIGGSDYDEGYSAFETSDHKYIMTGYSLDPISQENTIAIKFDTNGDTLWTKSYNDINNVDEEGHSIKQNSDGSFAIAGIYWNGSSELTNLCLIRTDANGNAGCSIVNLNMSVTDFLPTIGTPTWVLSAGGTVSSPLVTGNNYGQQLETICTTVNIDEVFSSYELIISPNPAKNNLFIQSFEKIKSIKCTNYLGQIIELKLSTNSLDISILSNGIYFLTITNEKGIVETKKFVKQ